MRPLAALFLALSLPLSAEPPDGSAEALAPILKRLDAEDFGEREAASRDLERWFDAAGAQGEAILTKARETASPEVAVRVGAVLGLYERAREGRKYLGRFFDGAGLPSVAGKTRVEFNTGEGLRALDPRDVRYVRGWILSKTVEELLLLEDDYGVHSRSRKGKGRHAPGKPAPGKYRKSDFAAECREWVANRSTRELARDEEPLVARTMIFGWWAFQSGLDRLGVACLDRLQADAEALPRLLQLSREIPAERLLGGCLAEQLRRAVGCAAVEGRPRAELLALWKGIAGLPEHAWSEEAAEFVKGYASLLEDDAAWVEPSAEERAKLDVAAQARYWIHHLRDHREKSGASRSRGWSTGAMKKLVALGWEAVPEIVAHLDDWRPVRALGCDDADHPGETWFLLAVADCCRAVLEEITGLNTFAWACAHDLTTGGPEWRRNLSAAARAWWLEAENKTMDARLFDLLVTNPGPAARALLKRDAAKHLPALLREAAIDRPRRDDLIRALFPALGKEHRAFLEDLLEVRNPNLVLVAAEALWDRCGADSGARKLVERVGAFDREVDPRVDKWIEKALTLIVRVRGDFAAEALVRYTHHRSRLVRLAAIQQARLFPDPRVARALAALLDDREPDGTGMVGGGTHVNPRWCDQAAVSLAEMLGDRVKFKILASEAERDDAITVMRMWWEDHGDKVAWEELRPPKK